MWCNGNTKDFGSFIQGSNPCIPTKLKGLKNYANKYINSYCVASSINAAGLFRTSSGMDRYHACF